MLGEDREAPGAEGRLRLEAGKLSKGCSGPKRRSIRHEHALSPHGPFTACMGHSTSLHSFHLHSQRAEPTASGRTHEAEPMAGQFGYQFPNTSNGTKCPEP